MLIGTIQIQKNYRGAFRTADRESIISATGNPKLENRDRQLKEIQKDYKMKN